MARDIDAIVEGAQRGPEVEAEKPKNPFPRGSARWKKWNKDRNKERHERERQAEGQNTDSNN